MEVELLSDDVEIRIGETKWAGVAYMREGKSKVYVRTKAEFKAKFDALKLTPVLGESIEIVVPTPVAVTVSSNTNPAVPAADKPSVFERVGPFG